MNCQKEVMHTLWGRHIQTGKLYLGIRRDCLICQKITAELDKVLRVVKVIFKSMPIFEGCPQTYWSNKIAIWHN